MGVWGQAGGAWGVSLGGELLGLISCCLAVHQVSDWSRVCQFAAFVPLWCSVRPCRRWGAWGLWALLSRWHWCRELSLCAQAAAALCVQNQLLSLPDCAGHLGFHRSIKQGWRPHSCTSQCLFLLFRCRLGREWPLRSCLGLFSPSRVTDSAGSGRRELMCNILIQRCSEHPQLQSSCGSICSYC